VFRHDGGSGRVRVEITVAIAIRDQAYGGKGLLGGSCLGIDEMIILRVLHVSSVVSTCRDGRVVLSHGEACQGAGRKRVLYTHLAGMKAEDITA